MVKDFKKIVRIIKDLDEDQLNDFLFGILSAKEREQLIIRFKIVQLLKKSIPQHKIALDLGVGIATVSRGSKMIKEGRFEYVK